MRQAVLASGYDHLTTGRLMFDLIDEFGSSLQMLALYGRGLRGEGAPVEAFALVSGFGETVTRDLAQSDAKERYRMPDGSALRLMDADGDDWTRFREELRLGLHLVYERRLDVARHLLGDKADELVLM